MDKIQIETSSLRELRRLTQKITQTDAEKDFCVGQRKVSVPMQALPAGIPVALGDLGISQRFLRSKNDAKEKNKFIRF